MIPDTSTPNRRAAELSWVFLKTIGFTYGWTSTNCKPGTHSSTHRSAPHRTAPNDAVRCGANLDIIVNVCAQAMCVADPICAELNKILFRVTSNKLVRRRGYRNGKKAVHTKHKGDFTPFLLQNGYLNQLFNCMIYVDVVPIMQTKLDSLLTAGNFDQCATLSCSKIDHSTAWETKLSYWILNFSHGHTVNFKSHHFEHESLLWSLMKHFCELFPEKFFNFHELSEFN